MPPKLIGDDDATLLEPADISLSELRSALDQQLDVHGFRNDGPNAEHRAMAAAVARNAQAPLWIEYQNARAALARSAVRIAELERQLALRPCAWVEHDYKPEPRIGAHVCSRCHAVGGGPLGVELDAPTVEVSLAGGR